MKTPSSEPISWSWAIRFIGLRSIMLFSAFLAGWAIGTCGQYTYRHFFPSPDGKTAQVLGYTSILPFSPYPSVPEKSAEVWHDPPEAVHTTRKEHIIIHVAYDVTDLMKSYPSMSDQEVLEFFADWPEVIPELQMQGVVKAFRTHSNAANHQ